MDRPSTERLVERQPRGRRLARLFRLAALLVVVGGCLTAALLLYNRFQVFRARAAIVSGGASDLSPTERLFLQTYLSARTDQLRQPVGQGEAIVPFTVAAGESADVIAANLAAAGLLQNRELFLNYVRYYGYDDDLEAGVYNLDPQMTLPDLALALTDATAQSITLRFIEGWRIEEMANYLAVTTPGRIDAAAFLAIAWRERPFDLGPYDFLASHPADASLEGYLFPDTYTVPNDADAADLVGLMLANFGRRITPQMRQAFGAQGLSLREALTLASIVEREAVLPAERPLMAGVFLNRLRQGIKLEADPTVQYAVGYHQSRQSWWKSPLSQDDLALDSAYNTYRYGGLPPGPIANPGLAALEAVANPVATDFIFFVVDCAAGDGSHLFSVTYDEHLANVQRCR